MATQALATQQQSTSMDAVERVLIGGDLSKLSSDERVFYYKSVCESVGLNPLTRPFEYITLNGKLVLYARKDCADQLRTIHGVSVTIAARELVDGIYVVTARATKPDGRSDESIGAVPVENLKGEAKANAFMKCETKSKRRVTLSICGLGMLDETEIESIPTARVEGTREAQRQVAETKITRLKSEDESPLVPVLQASIEVAKAERAQRSIAAPAAASDKPHYPDDVLQRHWKEMKDFKSILAKFAWAKEKMYEMSGDKGQEEYYAILGEFSMNHANEFNTPANARMCFEQLWHRIWDWEQSITVGE